MGRAGSGWGAVRGQGLWAGMVDGVWRNASLGFPMKTHPDSVLLLRRHDAERQKVPKANSIWRCIYIIYSNVCTYL